MSVLEVGVGQVGFAELAAVEPRGAGVAARQVGGGQRGQLEVRPLQHRLA